MTSLQDETSRFMQAWMGVRQIVQSANFNQFHRAGLSATQFMIINQIPQDGITLSDLARRLNLSPATLSKTVDSLEERGLVRRERNRTDTRKFNIFATTQGEEMQNAASGEFHRTMSGLFARMSKRDREALVNGLEQLVTISETARSDVESAPNRRVGAAPRAKHNAR